MRTLRISPPVALLALTLTLAGCGGGSGDGPGGGLSTFDEQVDAGASCEELFDRRDGADPDSDEVIAMNLTLREVGCYSRDSMRLDLEPR